MKLSTKNILYIIGITFCFGLAGELHYRDMENHFRSCMAQQQQRHPDAITDQEIQTIINRCENKSGFKLAVALMP